MHRPLKWAWLVLCCTAVGRNVAFAGSPLIKTNVTYENA